MKSLAWLPDDTKLVSAGVDGAVYEWRLKDFKRSKENVLKACPCYMLLDRPALTKLMEHTKNLVCAHCINDS